MENLERTTQTHGEHGENLVFTERRENLEGTQQIQQEHGKKLADTGRTWKLQAPRGPRESDPQAICCETAALTTLPPCWTPFQTVVNYFSYGRF